MRHRGGLIGLGGYALVWGAAIAVLAALGSDAVGDGVAVMAFMGVAFSWASGRLKSRCAVRRSN